MARSLNQCNFIGNLGNDPEVRYMPSGSAVANLSIAVSDDYKDKQTGAKVEQTEWVRAVAFGNLAEIIVKYLKKGSKVYISGRMKTNKWQDQSGADRYSTEIVINDMQMLDSRQDGQQQANQQQRPAQKQATQASNVAPQQNAPADDFEDSIPF